MNYLCIDLGTTKIKLSLFEENCDLIYSSEINSTIHKKNNLIFQDPNEYFFLIQKEIEKIKNTYKRGFVKISSIIFSGQMGGILSIDDNYEVIFPWTYSIDTSYLSYVYSLEQKIGEEIRKKSGGPPTIAGKICWIRDKFPEKYKQTKKFMNLMGFVAGKLCDLDIKNSFIDCTCLSMTGMADIEKLKWDYGLIKEIDIDFDKLPKIALPFNLIGTILKRKFETNQDINVFAGCGDQIAGFIGSGIINNNDIVEVSGTYNLLGFCTDKFIPDYLYKSFHSISLGIKDLYFQLSVISAGGYTFEWFLKNFNYKIMDDKYYCNIPSNIFLTPYFGGRYSPTQPYFKGSFLNLSWENNLDDIYISLLESNGYEIKYSLELLCKINKLDFNTISEIKIIGSGSKNYLENFIKTNILNLNYKKMINQPYENIGTFILAKYGIKLRDGVKELIETGKIIGEYEVVPHSPEKEIYRKKYNKYLKIVENLRRLYLKL
jgi:xylulokinase